MYTYYKKVQDEEHMLYATEIAELYGVVSVNNIPATRLVSRLLDEYIKKNNLEAEQHYYITKRGFQSKVYPASVYSVVMEEFKKSLLNLYGLETILESSRLSYKVDNVRFQIKIRK